MTSDNSYSTVIKNGEYKGSLCNLIVREGVVSVVVSEDQLELLNDYKNYDFHFDEKGELVGTGCGVSAWYRNKGEILYHSSQPSVVEEEK